MVRSCKESIDKLRAICHTLVVWSSSLYLVAALYAISRGRRTLGAILLTMAGISFVYHSHKTRGDAAALWENLDTVVTSIGLSLLLVYGAYTVWRGKTKMSAPGVLVALTLLSLTVLGFADTLAQRDPNTGFTGPLADSMLSPDITMVENKLNQECFTSSLQTEYLIYLVLWHVLRGFTAIFYVSISS